mmetsp:Transcript_3310/g.11657  ORF Transcript_3310/g.11657 Transcript_3310/m.11657 type:complete len:299 (+) Transcript_3310:1128-2024(+)
MQGCRSGRKVGCHADPTIPSHRFDDLVVLANEAPSNGIERLHRSGQGRQLPKVPPEPGHRMHQAAAPEAPEGGRNGPGRRILLSLSLSLSLLHGPLRRRHEPADEGVDESHVLEDERGCRLVTRVGSRLHGSGSGGPPGRRRGGLRPDGGDLYRLRGLRNRVLRRRGHSSDLLLDPPVDLLDGFLGVGGRTSLGWGLDRDRHLLGSFLGFLWRRCLGNLDRDRDLLLHWEEGDGLHVGRGIRGILLLPPVCQQGRRGQLELLLLLLLGRHLGACLAPGLGLGLGRGRSEPPRTAAGKL